jgi:hypothetical protein
MRDLTEGGVPSQVIKRKEAGGPTPGTPLGWPLNTYLPPEPERTLARPPTATRGGLARGGVTFERGGDPPEHARGRTREQQSLPRDANHPCMGEVIYSGSP